ncbi:OpgC domain-containing protein [Neoroseomonas soli]|uniref:Succinyl transferase OpgC n=1 Tax=Neoroseomonas soli TaxID=1081025 RepID=A0A9X9WRW9_9PROT|nr:OpgC domain-containing protein [Neoroseomonas soli]MBR0669898.1 succinyl transferase OpgC [Neoroseomonas soli]
MARPDTAAGDRPRLTRPARDTRLDIVRGWLQISIFGAHAVGSAFGAWGIHAAWGLSDSSEQFLFLSGFVLGSVHTLKERRDGAGAAGRDIWQRAGRLWLTHLVLFCMFGAMILWAEMALPLPGEVDRLAWRTLADAPWAALPGAALLVYLPNYIDILPVFILAMLALPGFLWLAGRLGAVALLVPGLLWAGVQAGLWHYWSWLPTGLDPLAWQFVFMLGAWFGRQALLRGAAMERRGWGIALAFAILGLGLFQRVAEHVAGGFALDAELAWVLAGKTHLGPLALAHGLALAYLVAVLVPREAAWMRAAPAQALTAVGRHSLNVFCVGLFLSWGVTAAFRLAPGVWWVDPVLTLGGIAVLVACGLAMERRRLAPAPARP